MFKTERIEKLVECALMSGFIKDDVPLSLMLIASPECAKTSILNNFECHKTMQVMDLSPKGIRDVLIPKVNNEGMHHIIIPDLVKIIAHKENTVAATIAFLNALMEEGVKDSLFFGQEFHSKNKVVCGVITSITNDYFMKVYKKWNDIGFTTRFLPVAYDYSDETVHEIHAKIQKNINNYDIFCIKQRGLKDSYSIPLGDEEASYISVHSQDIIKKQSGFSVPIMTQGGNYTWVKPEDKGFRLQRQLRQVARALALIRDKKTPKVTWTDIEQLKDLLEYINLPNSKKLI